MTGPLRATATAERLVAAEIAAAASQRERERVEQARALDRARLAASERDLAALEGMSSRELLTIGMRRAGIVRAR